MAVKAVIDSLEDVAEPLRAEYKEQTDAATKKTVYVLDIEGPIDPLPAVKALKNENAQRRQANTELSKKLEVYKPLEGRDVTQILADLDMLPELKLAAEGKLDDAKINTLVEGRVKAKIAPIERERDQWKAKAGEFEGAVKELSAKETRRLISTAANKAAKELKVVDSAIEDVEVLAERVLEVNSEGNVVTRDGVGVVPGLSAVDWLKDLQAKRPHWWGTSSGGGAPGSGGRGGAPGVNPWTHDGWNVTAQSQIVQADRARADKLASAAGTKVGGSRPKKA